MYTDFLGIFLFIQVSLLFRWQCGNSTNMHQKDHSHVVQTKVTEDDNKFCNGAGTDMYMQGFQVCKEILIIAVLFLLTFLLILDKWQQ